MELIKKEKNDQEFLKEKLYKEIEQKTESFNLEKNKYEIMKKMC